MGGTSTSSISARDVPPSSGDPGWTTSHPKSQAAGAVARQFPCSHSVRMPRKPDTIWLRTWAHKKVMSTIKMARKKKESWWFTRKMGLILGISGFPEIAYDMCVCDFVCACCLADTMCTFQPFVVIWCYMLYVDSTAGATNTRISRSSTVCCGKGLRLCRRSHVSSAVETTA